MKIPENALVVVADGGKAVLFRNAAKSGVQLRKDDKMAQAFLYQKGASSMPTESSPKEVDEATFAKHLAETLYKQIHAGSISNVVLIADPQTLGQIRPSLHKEVSEKIVCELAKDLSNSPIPEIEKILQAA